MSDKPATLFSQPIPSDPQEQLALLDKQIAGLTDLRDSMARNGIDASEITDGIDKIKQMTEVIRKAQTLKKGV